MTFASFPYHITYILNQIEIEVQVIIPNGYPESTSHCGSRYYTVCIKNLTLSKRIAACCSKLKALIPRQISMLKLKQNSQKIVSALPS